MRLLHLLLLVFLKINPLRGFEVPEYDDENFQEKISVKEPTLVMFYAPWCGHCKKLKPEFEKAAKTLISDDDKVILAKVDCTEKGKETCGTYDVSGYPTLKLFRNGKFVDNYENERNYNGILNQMRKISGPATKELINKTEIDEVIDNSTLPVVLGAFKTNSPFFTKFEEIASTFFEIKFFHVLHDVDGAFNEQVLLYHPKHFRNKFEEYNYILQIQNDEVNFEEKLRNFITSSVHSLVDLRTPSNSKDFKKPSVVAYYDVDFKKNAKQTHYVRNRLLVLAQRFRDRLSFSISDLSLHEVELEGLPTKKRLVIVITDTENRQYVMNDDFSYKTLENFVENYINGSLEPHVKSEPVPEENNGPVKIAVGATASKLLLLNKKDVFVLFYVPWCSNCKKFAPVFEDLAAKMHEDVEFYKMDANNNEIPKVFKVSGYPTLYWIPKSKAEAIEKYEDKREWNKLVKFIAKRATDGLKNYDKDGNAISHEKVEL